MFHSASMKACVLLFGIALLSSGPVGTARAQTLKADYQFQNDLTSSVSGAPDLTPIGGGTSSFVTDTVDGQTRTVYDFEAGPTGAGLQANTTGLTAPDNYSVVVLADLNALTGISKLADFKNLTSDAGLYSNSGLISFYDGGAMVTASGGTLTVDQYAQIVLTRDGATNQVTGYSDGVQAFTFTDTSGLAVIDDPSSANAFLDFFIDDGLVTPLDENPSGRVARIRLYDGVLSATQVAGLDPLPGGTTAVPEPGTLALLAGPAVAAMAGRKRRK